MVRRDPANASIEIVIHGDDVSVGADDEIIRAIVLNLLLNATQAIGGSGRITVTGHGRVSRR